MIRALRHSIRVRLTLWYAGLLALALVVFAVSVYLFVVRTLQADVDQALRGYGEQVEGVASTQVHGRRLDVEHLRIPPVDRSAPITALLVMDIGGEERSLARDRQRPLVRQLRLDLRSGTERCGTTTIAQGIQARRLEPFRYCTQLIYKRGKAVAGVEVVESLVGVNRALYRLRLALLLGIPFVLIVAVAGGWILAGRALEPVSRVTDMARSISATDLSRRIHLQREDELGRLADTFDDMIARLEHAFREQRQLAADVSHELRSPLAILEGQTTLALRRSRSSDEYRQVLLSVQEEVEHMSDMLSRLLTLARADAGEEAIAPRRVSLGDLTLGVVEAMQPLADERDIHLTVRCEGSTEIVADPRRYRQLVLNLLDNALEHTRASGSVEVTVTERDHGVSLVVADSGVGIAAEDLPHIFQRFYRVDRARRRGSGHSGLGLSIVKWIADAHGATIDVQSAPGRGTLFRVDFPRPHAVSQPA